MGAGFGLGQFEFGAAGHDFQPVVDERLQDLREIHGARTVVVDHEHLAAEDAFHLSVGVKLVQDHRAHGAAFDLDDDPDTGAQTGLVAQVGNAGDAFFLDQFADLLDQHFLVDRVGDLADDDEFLAALFDDFGLGADLDHAVTGLIKTADRVDAADQRAGREIGSGQILHELANGSGGMFQQMHRGVHHFAQIVRRDVGGHADADTHAAVDQQVREFRGQDFRLDGVLVECRDHVDRILVDVRQQFLGEAFHAAFGVTVCGRGVAVDAAEVAVAVHQRHAHGEILRHADQRVVNGRIAVRMVFTDHFADHAGALHVGTGFDQSQLAHGKEDAAVAGFETVPDVRNGAAHVDAQRILQIRSMHDVFDIDGDIPFFNGFDGYIAHEI